LFYNARTKNLYEKCLPFWHDALISSEKQCIDNKNAIAYIKRKPRVEKTFSPFARPLEPTIAPIGASWPVYFCRSLTAYVPFASY